MCGRTTDWWRWAYSADVLRPRAASKRQKLHSATFADKRWKLQKSREFGNWHQATRRIRNADQATWVSLVEHNGCFIPAPCALLPASVFLLRYPSQAIVGLLNLKCVRLLQSHVPICLYAREMWWGGYISAFVCVRGRERTHLATKILSVYGTVKKNGSEGAGTHKWISRWRNCVVYTQRCLGLINYCSLDIHISHRDTCPGLYHHIWRCLFTQCRFAFALKNNMCVFHKNVLIDCRFSAISSCLFCIDRENGAIYRDI